MINSFDILQKINKYIEYNCDTENSIATLFVSWADQTLLMWYDVSKQLFYTKFPNNDSPYPFEISPDAVMALTTFHINTIAKDADYPPEYIIYSFNGNRCNNIKFPIDPSIINREKQELLCDLCHEIYCDGLKREHVQLAREADVYKDFCVLVALLVGVNIYEKE